MFNLDDHVNTLKELLLEMDKLTFLEVKTFSKMALWYAISSKMNVLIEEILKFEEATLNSIEVLPNQFDMGIDTRLQEIKDNLPESVVEAIVEFEVSLSDLESQVSTNRINLSEHITVSERELLELDNKVTNTYNELLALIKSGTNLVENSKTLSSAYVFNSWIVTNDLDNEGFNKLYLGGGDTTIWHECNLPLYIDINSLYGEITVAFEYRESAANSTVFSMGVYNGANRIKEITNVIVTENFKLIDIGDSNWKRAEYTFDPRELNNVTGATHYGIQFKRLIGVDSEIQIRKPSVSMVGETSVEGGAEFTQYYIDLINDAHTYINNLNSGQVEINERLSANENYVQNLLNSISYMSTQIDTLTQTVELQQDVINELQDEVNNLRSSNTSDLSTINTNIQSLDSRVTLNENNIVSIQEDIANINSTLEGE